MKKAVRILAVLALLNFLVMFTWVLVAGPVTVWRILRYGDTNIDDFSQYPGRRIQAPSQPSVLELDDAAPIFHVDLPENFGSGSLEDVLEANDTLAFLVLRGGPEGDEDTILYEAYFQGHSASSLSQAFSVSKSITSILVGMAIADGKIERINQPVTDWLYELYEHGFDDVTVADLLSMRSGSDYDENDNPFKEHVILNYTAELEHRILRIRMQDEAGQVFRYKSGDNAMLGLILSRALRPETISAYAQRKLWQPLGMEQDAIWTLDHAGDGLEKTWCCLAASARDYARLGLLVLHGGNWHGKQLVPEAWVRASTQVARIPEQRWPQEYSEIGLENYGYFWWLVEDNQLIADDQVEEDAEGSYLGLGKDGQYLYVNPDRGIVIVRLGWSQGSLDTGDWIRLFQAISREN